MNDGTPGSDGCGEPESPERRGGREPSNALRGGVAVVTGGAGTGAGLGRGLVRQFAAAGMRVAILDIDGDSADELAAELRAGGTEVLSCTVDVRDHATLREAATRLAHEFGACNVLCAHAGGGSFGPVDGFGIDEWRRAFDLMVLGTIATVQSFLPLMRATEGPRRIVLTSSAAALAPGRFQGPYRAAKAAVTSIGETLQLELADEGIGTTIVFPSGMLAPMSDDLATPPADLELAEVDPALLSAITEEMAAHETDIATGEEAAVAVIRAIRDNRHYVVTHGATVVARARERQALLDAALTEVTQRDHRTAGEG